MLRPSLLLLACLALGACADTSINLSDFDTSCAKDNDCVVVNVGDICGCHCGNAAINVSSEAAYDAEEQDKQAHCVNNDPCLCPANGSLACTKGVCVFTP
jgi:hypothetical protein